MKTDELFIALLVIAIFNPPFAIVLLMVIVVMYLWLEGKP